MIEVVDLPMLVRAMRRSVISWYPIEKLPTIANTKVEEYYPGEDPHTGWKETRIVLVDGAVWGFTNGPL